MSTNEELTDIQEIHFIELPKLKENDEVEVSSLLEAWISFIKNPESKRVKTLENRVEEIKKAKEAKEELIYLSSDKEQRDLYLRRKMAISDRVSDLENAEKKGERTKQIEIAKKALKEGLDKDLISTLTGLTLDEVLKINKSQ